MDKRSCRRLPVRVGCWLVEVDALACIQTFDISDNGVCVVSDELLPLGKAVQLQFFTPRSATPVRVEGEVVWCREEEEGAYAMGLKFLAIGESARQTIREFSAYLHQEGRRHSLG